MSEASKLPTKPAAFHALHAVYHERDFRVRVNDPTINMVHRILAEEVQAPITSISIASPCPACRAGYDYLAVQPNDDDRRR